MNNGTQAIEQAPAIKAPAIKAPAIRQRLIIWCPLAGNDKLNSDLTVTTT